MPCYKMGCFIGDALASVGAQSYPNWEVIAVDDCGPDDGTRQAIQAFACTYPDHRIEYIRLEENKGVSAARNTAIHAAQGVWLAFLDPDDTWDANKLAVQCRCILANPDIVGIAAFASIERGGEGVAYSPSLSVIGAVEGGISECGPVSITGGRTMFPFCSVVLRRDKVLRVGGFQECLPFQNEDRLLTACVAALGPFTVLEEILCTYRVHDGSATTSVIKQDAAQMVEFDLRVRVALWLKSQSGLSDIGKAVVSGPCREKLAELLDGISWLRWRVLVIDLCARLVLAYPGQFCVVVSLLIRQTPLIALLRRIIKLTLVPDRCEKTEQ